MKYTEPKLELIEIEVSDLILASGETFNPDKPSLGDEERE